MSLESTGLIILTTDSIIKVTIYELIAKYNKNGIESGVVPAGHRGIPDSAVGANRGKMVVLYYPVANWRLLLEDVLHS